MRDDNNPVLFVSHHSSKLQTAEHVEKALAARGISCWIAPRDVNPGEPFDRAVHKAIGQTDAMLLLFCSKSEKSRHVKRELILADQLDKAIIPLRLERIDPGELSYHLADSQWIDWLEQRDDVIDRIAAKAREFRDEGHARAGAGGLVQPVGGGAGETSGWPAPPRGVEEVLPVDLPDAAPSHSAAVGAASDLRPHALGAFPGPGAAGMAPPPGDRGSAGFGPGGYGFAGSPPAPSAEPGRRGNMMWVWAGLGALILVVAVVLAIILSSRGGGSSNPGQGSTQPVTAEWFAGVWADTRDCREPYRFDRSGQVTFPTALQGRWSIEGGDTLVVEANGQAVRKRITRVADDEVRAEEGSTYRCFPGAT